MQGSSRSGLRTGALRARLFLLVAAALAGCGVTEIERPGAPEPQPPAPDPVSPPPTMRPPASEGTAPTGAPPSPPAQVMPDPAAPPPATSPPLSGVTITIGGKEIPREKAIVILHIGHSNMAGRAQGPADLRPYFYDTHPQLWRYQKGGVWTPAKEWLCPDGGPDDDFPQGAGPGMALLRQALVAAPDATIISIGNGQSLNYSASCFTFRKGSLHWPKSMDPAIELKGKVTFGGVFTMFGYDGRNNPRARNNGYISCLQGLAAEIRAELGDPNLPFVAGDYERGATDGFSPSTRAAQEVIAQLAMVPLLIPRSFLIPTDGVDMQDNHHYSMLGHKQWAERGFAGLARLGLLPWAAAR
jgi:hypothetical protein